MQQHQDTVKHLASWAVQWRICYRQVVLSSLTATHFASFFFGEIRRNGNSARWEFGEMGIQRNGNSARWELGKMGIQQDGNSARWEDTVCHSREVLNNGNSCILHNCVEAC